MGTMFTIIFTIFVGFVAYKIYRCGLFCEKQPPKLDEEWWGPGKRVAKEDTSIRPFTISVSDEQIKDLEMRLKNTRFPSKPLENINFEYGFNSLTLKTIVNYWRTQYKWREREAMLNRLPQYKTQIQGLDLHYIHVKPTEGTGIPLLLLHGWAGSVREFYQIIEILKDTKNGPVFEIIVPSLPGFGWSTGAARPGLATPQMAVVMAQLMKRLGHKSYYVHGGDWGSQIASHMGILYPKEVKGIHISMCGSMATKTYILGVLASFWPSLFMEDRFVKSNYPILERFNENLLESGYFHIQATKPDTVGAGLADSPAGLVAYILEKFSTATNRTFRNAPDGGLTKHFTYDDLLDNIMIYWWTNSITTSMRIYAEDCSKENRRLDMDNIPVKVPTWCIRFPYEVFYQPDWMLRHRYVKLMGVTDKKEGGHFAAMERPKDLADDIKHAVNVIEKEYNF